MKYILDEYERSKLNNQPDSLFYSSPRYSYHLDQSFRERLTKLYSEVIETDSIILDLMSSWVSHLPDYSFSKVIGHGLNIQELERNPRLNQYWIQDLNINQQIPLENNSVNYCLLTAGWQYLQYPEKISSEMLRIVKPKGKFIISFSNRAFWEKSPNIWINSSDQARIDYISAVLLAQGWSIDNTIIEQPSSPNILSIFGHSQDPFFSVIATKLN